MIEFERKTNRERREELLKIYKGVPRDQKLVLQVLAVIGATTHMDINSVFSHINQGFTAKAINLHIKTSMQLRLINNDYRSQFVLEPPLLVPVIESASEDGILDKIIAGVEAFKKNHFRYSSNDNSGLTVASMVQQKYIPRIYNSNPLDENEFDNLYSLYNNPFNKKYLSYLPINLQILILKSILKAAQVTFEPAPEAFEYTRYLIKTNRDTDRVLLVNAGTYCLALNKFTDFDDLINNDHDCPVELAGIVKFLRGEDQVAVTCFNEALKYYRKVLHRSGFFFKGPAGAFFLLSLLRSGTDENRNLVWKIVVREINKDPYWKSSIIHTLRFLFDENGLFLNGQLIPVDRIPKDTSDCIEAFVRAAVLCWRNTTLDDSQIKSLTDVFFILKKTGAVWFASEMAKALFRITKNASWQKQADVLYPGWKCTSFIDSIVVEEKWERALASLNSLKNTVESAQTTESRICWRITISDYSYHHFSVACTEQKMLKNGKWSTGKNIRLQKLSEKNDLVLSDQDNRAIRILLSDPYDQEKQVAAIAALVGHPNVISGTSPPVPIEISSSQPELQLKSVLPNQSYN